VTLNKVNVTLGKVHMTLATCMRHLTRCIRRIATLATLRVRYLGVQFWCVTYFPLKCEVRRETGGRDTIQILQCKGAGVGELGKKCKQSSISIQICSISEADIPMLGIRDDSKYGRLPIQCGSMRILTKDMATKYTLWIHNFVT
jgi:hypothetical protein